MTIPILRAPVVLDRRRVRTRGRRIEWPVSYRTLQRFREALHELVELEDADQTSPWVRQRMEALRDDIRSLPGYPRGYDPENDLIVPTLTSVTR